MNYLVLYFENFSFVSLLSGLFKHNLLKNLLSKKYKTIYFIDASLFAQRFLSPLLRFFGLNVEKLQFTMLEIVDSNGELVRIRITRKDLFNFQEIRKPELLQLLLEALALRRKYNFSTAGNCIIKSLL